MPSRLFLRGDSDDLWLALPADMVLAEVARAEEAGERFLRLDMTPYTREEKPRPAYFDPRMVAAILPLDERQYEHALDDLPDWLADG